MTARGHFIAGAVAGWVGACVFVYVLSFAVR